MKCTIIWLLLLNFNCLVPNQKYPNFSINNFNLQRWSYCLSSFEMFCTVFNIIFLLQELIAYISLYYVINLFYREVLVPKSDCGNQDCLKVRLMKSSEAFPTLGSVHPSVCNGQLLLLTKDDQAFHFWVLKMRGFKEIRG